MHAIIGIDPDTRSVSADFSYTGPLFQGGLGVPQTVAMTIPDGETFQLSQVLDLLVGHLAATIEIVHLTDAPLPIDALVAEQAIAAAMVPQMRVAP